MSLSKIVVTGKAVRNPEKRFTGNNLAITSFAINIGADNEEKIVRVFCVGKLAETTETTVKKGSNIIVEGRLQTNTVKTEAGVEKKIVEINAQGIELISGSAGQESAGSIDSSDFDFGEDISVDDLIGEDEIPF